MATEKVDFGEFEPNLHMVQGELQTRPLDVTAATARRLSRRGIVDAEALAVVLAHPDFLRTLPFVRGDMIEQIENTEFQLALEERDAASTKQRTSGLLSNALRLLLSTKVLRQ